MSQPHSLENTLRVHDVALYKWLGGIGIDYGMISGEAKPNHPLLRVFATPQRAFATIVDLLVHTGWISGADAESMRQNAGEFDVLPLPVATITRGDPTLDTSNAGVPKLFRGKSLDTGAEISTWAAHQHPAVYLIPYQVTFWMKKTYTENYIREWIMSQLGLPGAIHNEVFLMVDHAEPWGPQRQGMTFEGSSDLSDLEGAGQRFRRFDYSFSLRMLHFRNKVGDAPIVNRPAAITATQSATDPIDSFTSAPPETVAREAVAANPGSPSEELSPLYDPDPAASPNPDPSPVPPPIPDNPHRSADVAWTANFFRIVLNDSLIPTRWPKAGNAGVQRSRVFTADARFNGLRVALQAQEDAVELVEHPVHIPTVFDRALISIAGTYRASGTFAHRVESVNTVPDPQEVAVIARPEFEGSRAWRRFHYFVLSKDDRIGVHVEGTGQKLEAELGYVDVRQVYENDRIPPSSITGVGDALLTWVGVENQEYLLALELTDGAGLIEATASQVTQSQMFDANVQFGVVMLLQPDDGTVTATVPAGITIDRAHLVPFDGFYHGNG